MTRALSRRRITVAAATSLGLLAGREFLRRRNAVDFRGQVVLITGGSRGLGFALGQEFARQGARLAICARSTAGLEQARQALVQQGADVLAIPCDVTDRGQVRQLVQQATAHFGRIDVLVNNAGIIVMAPLQSQTVADFEDAMNVMFWGALYPTLEVLPQMQARRSGRIVNITSIGGKISTPHLLSYSAAKFAQVGLSEGLRAELARDGITVVTVVPGFMRTGSHINAFFKGNHRAEYTVFSLAGNLPFTSMCADRAAKQIVRATQRGDATMILTLQAHLLTRIHGLFPGITADVLSMVNRALPGVQGGTQQLVRGKDSESMVSASFLTALGRRAARTYHQYSEQQASQSGR